jgi:CheY-like chemotaxis protein
MGKTILVAEDDPNDQFLIQRELKKLVLPVQVRFVNDGEQTIDYLSGVDKPGCPFPKPDLMFLDLKMPRLNGFELLEWMRKDGRCGRILTVVVSSSSLQHDIDKAYDLGANAYLVKPASLQDYVRVFRTTAEFFLEYAQQPSLQKTLTGHNGSGNRLGFDLNQPVRVDEGHRVLRVKSSYCT